MVAIYIILFEKRHWQGFEISCEKTVFTLKEAPPSFNHRLAGSAVNKQNLVCIWCIGLQGHYCC